MTRKEIAELMRLKGWTQAELARQLHMSDGAVSRWFTDRKPRGPATLLMKQWLEEARCQLV